MKRKIAVLRSVFRARITVIIYLFCKKYLCEKIRCKRATIQINIMFKIRPAREGEEHILYDLIRELAIFEKKDVDSLPLTKENLRRFGFEKNPYFFTEFAEVEGVIVGYALYFYIFDASEGLPILYLEDLYVKHDYRNHGVGMAFMKRLAALAKDRHCSRMQWHVYIWNKNAINFYQELGGTLKEDLVQVRLANLQL